MSLLFKARLSELDIDVDKDWQGFGISNLKEVVEAMGHGDMTFKTTSTPILVKLPPFYGIGAHYLHSKSIGGGKFEPEWKDIQDLIAFITGGVNRMITLPIMDMPAPSIGVAVAAVLGGGVVATPPSLVSPTPSIGVPATATYSPAAVGGAIADDGGVQTVETTQANNPTANDMTLLPAVPAVGDAYYFGLSTLWDWLSLNIGQAGAGTWTIVWEYYNGTTWVSLPSAQDTSNGFRAGGYHSVTFARPADWATSTILLLSLYWIRARVSAYTSVTTQPLGTQAWIGIH